MTRHHSGYYSYPVYVALTRDGGTKLVEAVLTINRRDRGDALSNLPWTWSLACETEAFDEQDEDGGYRTKRDITEAFGHQSKPLRNWTYHSDRLGWCI